MQKKYWRSGDVFLTVLSPVFPMFYLLVLLTDDDDDDDDNDVDEWWWDVSRSFSHLPYHQVIDHRHHNYTIECSDVVAIDWFDTELSEIMFRYRKCCRRTCTDLDAVFSIWLSALHSIFCLLFVLSCGSFEMFIYTPINVWPVRNICILGYNAGR